MSKALTLSLRLTRRCAHARARDILCFFAGVIVTSSCILFLYPLVLDDCSKVLCEVATTLPTDLAARPMKISTVRHTNVSLFSRNVTNQQSLPVIYIITPTYKRFTQKADLTRLCQTLMLVKDIVWILIEDSSYYSPLVTSLLEDCPVRSVHLIAATTSFVSRDKGGGGHRGVEQRNAGLRWIRENVDSVAKEGVVYFGDDDNAYDIRLFDEMRYTKIVSVWPVAFVGMLKYEAPKCFNGKVTGWHVSFRPDRTFPLDMAAFAVNLSLIMKQSHCYINPASEAGMLENEFLKQLGVTVEELEGRANDCKSVYVWHVKTEKPKFQLERKNPGDKNIIF